MKIMTQDVFGVSRKQVRSYIDRAVDGQFKEALKSDKQIVVYGSSKQGKSALVSKHLPSGDCITTSVSPESTTTNIYKSVLRQLGVQIARSTSKKRSSDSSVKAKLDAQIKLPLVGSGKAGGGAQLGRKRESEITYEEVSYNLSLPQDVSELLDRMGVEKTIVVENFHYLDEEVQHRFAFDLRTFQDLGVQFVVLGVWREKNRLSQFNGDLTDRMVEIPVEPWTESEFYSVARKGARELNIDLSTEIIESCVKASFASIGVFQELLKEVCLHSEIDERLASRASIEIRPGDEVNALKEAIKKKAEEYGGRHERALESLAAGSLSASEKSDETRLFLPYYLVRTVLESGYRSLAEGMTPRTLREKIMEIHHRPDGVRQSDVSALLNNIVRIQKRQLISPPILDYDKTARRLEIVDSTFHFFLKHANLNRIVDELGTPFD